MDQQTKFLNVVGAIPAPNYTKYSYLITPDGEVLKTPLKDLHQLDWAKSVVLCKIPIAPKCNYSILKDGTIIEVVLGKDFDYTHIKSNPWKKVLKKL